MIQPTNSATMNAGAPVQKAYSAKSWDMHKWAMGSGADYWMYSQFANLMLVFSSDFHLDKRLIGIALCCPRILDGLIDPLVGHLSDITHTRWGRRRPFLLATAILGAFLAVAIWFPSTSWPQWALFTWLTIGATLLFSVWGTYAMAHAAMGYELSDDFNDRSRVVAIRNVYFSIMAVGGGWYFWGAIQLGKGFRWPIHLAGWEWTLNMPAVGELNGVRYLSFAAGVLILVCAAIPVFFCRERFVNANRKHVSLGKACLATFKCRPFVLLLAMQIIRGLGGVAGSMGVFIGIYYVCAGDRGLYMGASAGLSSFFGVTMSFLLWPLARPLTKLIGKRVGLIWSACVSLVFAILLPFITIPGHVYLLVFTGFVFAFLGSFGGVASAALMPDICDLDELASGERREGLFASVASCINKWENSIMMFCGMCLLHYSGFDEALAQQAPGVFTRMRWLYFTPPIVCGLATLILTLYFPITEKMMDEVRAQLQKRREALAAGGA